MPRRPLPALLLTLLLFAGHTQAQDWFGVRSGYPLGVTLHYGVDNGLTRGFDLRISGRVLARNRVVSIGFGLDVLRDITIEPPFNLYFGGGPAVEFGDDLFLLDIHGLLGAEFRFIALGLPQLGIFLEGSVGAAFNLSTGGATIPDFGAAVGVNVRF